MYFESSLSGKTRLQGELAVLQSPNILGTTDGCSMNFFYHMYGVDVGSLVVYMVSETSILMMRKITGNQGNRWINTSVTFTSLSDFRVHIVATYGGGFRGDIAIDDISFSNCKFNNRSDNSYCSNGKIRSIKACRLGLR